MAHRPSVRHLSLLTVSALLLLVLSNLTHATALGSFKTLDDTQTDFALGSFERTAISSGTSTTFNDGDGLLQLAAVGALKPWQFDSTGLPIPLGNPGVTTIGNRLYTVGGTSTTGFVDSAFWATASQATGAFLTHGFTETNKPTGSTLAGNSWINDPLPQTNAFMYPAPHSSCLTEVIQARGAPAVTSLVTGANTGYIYAIGGAFQPTCNPNVLTSPVVQIGNVTANGDISWQSSQANYLPSQDLPIFENWASPTFTGLRANALGVQGATASILRTNTGTAYLYVIGGLISYYDGAPHDLVTPAVFYTRLNQSTGALEYPLADMTYYVDSPWVRTANVPVNLVYGVSAPNPGDLGLYNHTAMVSRATVSSISATTTTEAIFVTGGYTTYDPINPSTANQTVFRATIADEATGAIQWETQLNPPNSNTVSTDGPRGNPAGFAYGGKLYVIGGVPTNASAAPVGTVSTALHDDSLNILPLFPVVPGSTTSLDYFIGGLSGATNVINPVSGLGAAVIQAAGAANTAWGYAIGGFDATNVPTTQIYRGALSGEGEATATKRAPAGWYYSRFHNIQLGTDVAKTEARVLSIRWSTIIDRTANQQADLTIEFRRTRLLPCNESAFATSSWMTLDADGGATAFYSGDGTAANRVEFLTAFPSEDPIATCFQYRVALTQNGNTGGVPNAVVDSTATPKLYKVEV